MKLLRFLLNLLRLPVDLCFLSWDFLRSVREGLLRLMHHPTHCSFCEELDAGGSPCRAANKYGNLWLFRSVCPCARGADDEHEGPWCGVDNSYERSLKHLPLTCLLIVAIWAGLAFALSSILPARDVPVIAQEGELPAEPERSRNTNSHLEKGLMYFKKGAYSDARISLLNARNADPEDGEVYHALGRLYMKLGEMENAFMSMKLAVQNLPEDMDARRRLAEVHLYRLENDSALEQLNIVCSKHPDDLNAGMFRVYTFREMGHLEAAKQELERVLAATGTNVLVKMQAADLFLGQGNLDRAESLYRSVPLEQKSQEGLIRIHLARGYREAAADALLALPDGKERAILQAESHILNGAFDAAVAEYERLLAEDPREESVKLKLAILLARMGKSDAAAARSEELLGARDPKNIVAAHGLLARIYLEKKLFRQSIEHADAILRLQKDNPTGLYVKAQALAGQGDKPQALDLLMTLDEARPGHLAGGLLMAALQEPLEAEQTYARLALAHPDSGVPYTFLSVLQFERKDFAACIETARKALGIQPKAALASNRLVLSLVELGRLEEAWRMVEVLYARQPRTPYTIDAYAWVLFKRGEVSEAASLLKSAAQKTSSPLVLYHAGVALMADGQAEEGRKHLRVAMGVGPNFPFAEEARTLLKPRED